MGNIFNFGFNLKDPAFVCHLLDMLSETQRGKIFKALYDFDGHGAFPETTSKMLNLVLRVIAHQAGMETEDAAPAETAPAEEGLRETGREIIEGGLKGGWDDGTIVRKNQKEIVRKNLKENPKENDHADGTDGTDHADGTDRPTACSGGGGPALTGLTQSGPCGPVPERAEEPETLKKPETPEAPETPETPEKPVGAEAKESAVGTASAGAKESAAGAKDGAADEVTDAECTFDAVWELYGKKYGSVSYLRGRWERHPMAERRKMVRYIRRYVAERPNPRFRRTFLNFLEQRTWETQPLTNSHGSIGIRQNNAGCAASEISAGGGEGVIPYGNAGCPASEISAGGSSEEGIRREIARIGEAERQAEELARMETEIDFKTLNEQCRIMVMEQRL